MRVPQCLRTLILAFVGAPVLAIGCGSKPIPLRAVAGTTITIAIPSEFPTGFGTRLAANPNPVTPTDPSIVSPPYDPSLRSEDPQRGDLVFDLYTTGGSFLRHLRLAYVTRVNMSPQSRSASAGSMLFERGQALAFVNIPYEVGAGSYLIRVIRYRRNAGSANAYQQVSTPLTSLGAAYYGWGDDSVASGASSSPLGVPITVVAGDGTNHFTPLRGWGDVAPYGVVWGDVSGDLADLTPYPEFDVLVPQAGSTLPKPAAWEAQIMYPRERLRIRGVELRHPTRSSAIVRWEAESPNANVPCGSLFGFLKVKIIDPDRVTSGIRVAYELRNFDQPCGGRAGSSTFTIWPGTFKAYDLNGVDVTSSMNFEIPASSFF